MEHDKAFLGIKKRSVPTPINERINKYLATYGSRELWEKYAIGASNANSIHAIYIRMQSDVSANEELRYIFNFLSIMARYCLFSY